MKPNQVTLLILAMFGSFAVVLTVMILVWRPKSPKPAPRQPAQENRPETKKSQAKKPDATPKKAAPTPEKTGPDPAAPQAEQTQSKPEKREPARRLAPPKPAPGAKLQKDLAQQKKEMDLLKTEMQRRLKEHTTVEEKKLTQLARSCEKLEPGEATKILLDLEDKTIASILEKMNRDKAIQIAALLKMHGREKAISIK